MPTRELGLLSPHVIMRARESYCNNQKEEKKDKRCKDTTIKLRIEFEDNLLRFEESRSKLYVEF